MRPLCTRSRSPVVSAETIWRSRWPARYCPTCQANFRASMGFCMKPSQPTAKLVSRSPSAVMATIGTPRSASSVRSRRVTS